MKKCVVCGLENLQDNDKKLVCEDCLKYVYEEAYDGHIEEQEKQELAAIEYEEYLDSRYINSSHTKRRTFHKGGRHGRFN